jgi:2-iminobutanoate/2-iminopropanoate deaminase
LLLGLSCTGLEAVEPAQDTRPIPVIVEEAPALGPYSSAMVHENVIYLSGIIAFNPQTKSFAEAIMAAQFSQAFANLETVLAGSGSDLEHVIKVTVYLKNPADFPKMNELYAKAFRDVRPARTTVPGVDWGRNDILLELDVIAARASAK